MTDNKHKTFQASMEDIAPLLKEVVNSGGEFSLITAGTSMLPLLRNRKDTVTLVSADSVGQYDIVLYQRQCGSYVLHRVMTVNTDSYDMCGDNQTKIEKNVPKEAVVAKVKSITKNGRCMVLDDSASYRLYTFFWCRLFVIRVIYLEIKFKLARIKSFFCR